MAKKLQVFGVIDPKGVVQSVNGVGPDENGDVNIEIPESVPATTEPHMQLVTDENGEKKWEERTHYSNAKHWERRFATSAELFEEAEKYDELILLTNEVTSFEQLLGYSFRIRCHDNDDFVRETEYGIIDDLSTVKIYENGSMTLHVKAYIDNTQYSTFLRVFPTDITFGQDDLPFTIKAGLYSGINGSQYICELSGSEIQPIPAEYLPTEVPVIQSATVGQTIIVKSVDENGKPTEWESASLPSKVSDLANDAGYLTEHQDLSAKVTLPTSNGTPNHGTAGQFAVSDGNGGIMWKTLVEAEEVSY